MGYLGKHLYTKHEKLLLNPDAPPFCPTFSLNKHLYTGINGFNKNILCNETYSPVFVPISIFCLILAYGLFLSLWSVNSQCHFLNKNIKINNERCLPNQFGNMNVNDFNDTMSVPPFTQSINTTVLTEPKCGRC